MQNRCVKVSIILQDAHSACSLFLVICYFSVQVDKFKVYFGNKYHFSSAWYVITSNYDVSAKYGCLEVNNDLNFFSAI